jgi:hypothetical protein
MRDQEVSYLFLTLPVGLSQVTVSLPALHTALVRPSPPPGLVGKTLENYLQVEVNIKCGGEGHLMAPPPLVFIYYKNNKIRNLTTFPNQDLKADAKNLNNI